ncbi:hypothetical protein ACU4HD_42565 [Cupriavidus basilensis]
MQQARASVTIARAPLLLPELTGSADARRYGGSGISSGDSSDNFRLGLAASYEVDLWARQPRRRRQRRRPPCARPVSRAGCRHAVGDRRSRAGLAANRQPARARSPLPPACWTMLAPYWPWSMRASAPAASKSAPPALPACASPPSTAACPPNC